LILQQKWAYFYHWKKPISIFFENNYLLTAIVATTKTTKTIARITVIQNKVFSIPRRALKTLPALCPVKPPQNDTNDQRQRRYNQCNLKICNQFVPPIISREDYTF